MILSNVPAFLTKNAQYITIECFTWSGLFVFSTFLSPLYNSETSGSQHFVSWFALKSMLLNLKKKGEETRIRPQVSGRKFYVAWISENLTW